MLVNCNILRTAVHEDLKHTCVAILEGGRARVEGGVDNRQQALVKVLGITKGALIFRAQEIVVRADDGTAAATAALKPGAALRVG